MFYAARARGATLAWRVALLSVSIALATSVAASTASALIPDPDYWKATQTRRDAVYRLMYSQSPQAIPVAYDPVTEEEGVLRAAQSAAPESNLGARAIWTEIRSVTIKSALSKPVSAIGTIGLAIDSFELGWKIGTGVNAKYLHIGVPGINNAPPAVFSSPQLEPYAAGQPMFFNAGMSGYEYAPADGFLFSFYNNISYQQSRTYVPRCANPINLAWIQGTGFPEGVARAPDYKCRTWGTSEEPKQADFNYQFIRSDDLPAPHPTEPYTNQPYDRSSPAPAPPAQSTAEQAITNALGESGNAALRQWLNYELGSPGETDPRGIGAPNPDIEFPGWREHFEQHGAEFDIPYTDAREYWRDAAEIVKRGDGGEVGYEKCLRSDGAEIYWDAIKQAIVIVKDGKIVTYMRPTGGYDYYDQECAS